MALRVTRQAVEALHEVDSELRVTRQAVEVLHPVSSELRVTRQAVEILRPYPIIERSVESTLSLTQSAAKNLHTESVTSTLSLSDAADFVPTFYMHSQLSLSQDLSYVGPKPLFVTNTLELTSSVREPEVFEVSASSDIYLAQEVVPSGDRNLSASNTLDLEQIADNIIKYRYLTSALSLSQAVVVTHGKLVTSTLALTQSVKLGAVPLSVSNILSLSQDVHAAPLPLAVTTQLALAQSVKSNFLTGTATTELALAQSVHVAGPIYVSATSPLVETEIWYDTATNSLIEVETGLTQSVDLEGDFSPPTDDQTLSLGQAVSVILIKASASSHSASNTLSLSQALHQVESASSSLSLSDSVKTGEYFGSDLTLTQAATVVIERGPALGSTLNLSQAAAFVIVSGSSLYQYTPFVGENTDPDAPTPPPTELQGPMSGIQVDFQLVYPATGTVTDSVSLRAPNLGNKDRLAFNRIQRETRGGTLIVFADPIWPKVQTLVLQFSGLFRVEAQALLDFMEAHPGQEVGLIDWEHRYWKGVITSPAEPIIEDRFDSYSASFEFQGELDPTWNPQVVPPTYRYSATRSEQVDGYYVPVEAEPPVTSEADYSEAVADSQIKIGHALYIKSNGHADLAQANGASSVQVAGVALSDAAAASTVKYITEGKVTRSDWTEVIGTTALTPGITYFLSSTTAGLLTATAPTTVGQYVVRVGRALDAETLDIEIELPVRL